MLTPDLVILLKGLSALSSMEKQEVAALGPSMVSVLDDLCTRSLYKLRPMALPEWMEGVAPAQLGTITQAASLSKKIRKVVRKRTAKKKIAKKKVARKRS